MSTRSQSSGTRSLQNAVLLFSVRLALLLLTGCATRGVDLNALRSWEIVVPAGAIPSERYAAEEFQRLYAQASGTTLPIREKPGAAAGRVFIGAPEAGQPAGAAGAAKKWGDEDVAIRVGESAIVIAGGRPRGALYGVYSFAEDYMGVRFLTADHTHVPPLASAAAARVPRGDHVYRPPLEFRHSYYRENERDVAFATRLRNNTITDDARFGGRTPMRLINHSFARYVPLKTYGKEHPEYFNETLGKRPENLTDDQFNPGVQLCLTNPDVLRIVTEGVLRDLDAQPGLRNISVSQNDNMRYCQCAKCSAIDQREGTPMGSLLTFVNAVADEVAKKHPDVLVGTLAYQYSRKPPATIRPRPNVEIQLCSIECCQNHPLEDSNCPLNVPFRSDMDGWGKICDQVYVWYYNVNFGNYLLPSANLRILGPDVRYLVGNGARGLLMQGAYNGPGTELSDLRNYIISRLLWNPMLDAGRLCDEFLDLHYAEAAEPIRRYIKFTHDRAAASGKHQRVSRPGWQYGLDREVAEMGLKSFAEAMALAKSDVVRQRLELASVSAHAMMVDALLDTGMPMTLNWRVHRRRPLFLRPMEAELAAARPHLKRMFEISERYGITMWSEWLSAEQAKEAMRKLYNLAEGESF